MRKRWGNLRHEENVFGFEVTVDEAGLIEDCEGIEELSGENLDELSAKATKLVLFDELVKVG